jgi:peptidoglycan hydrolase-like protein with peptidoglycan-binding domain
MDCPGVEAYDEGHHRMHRRGPACRYLRMLFAGGYVPGQPSIDCTKVHNTVAVILCRLPEAAEADWDLNSASWALYFTVNDSQRRMLDKDQQAWRQSLDQICALPRYQTSEDEAGRAMAETFGRMILGPGIRIPGPQPITQAHVNCVVNAYHARAAMFRSKLTGDALAESQLSPEQHAELQQALAEKGFLRPDQIGSGTHDGEFGPIIRNAIEQFQQSLGASASGFLSNDQRSALLESPQEREARVARAAEDKKAREDALVAQAAAAVKAKQDAQLEADRQRAQAEADKKAKQEAEKKRLEGEADAAKEWSRKVDEARTKGPQYAVEAGLKWSLSEQKNPMTDDMDYTVTTIQPNGKGAQASIEGTCQKPGRVVFLATLMDADHSDVPLGLPTFENMTIVGNKRINDDPKFATSFPNDKFRNRIVVATLSSLDTTESLETTWRVLAEIETSLGSMVVRIPLFDANVQKLIVACKRQGEAVNRHEGVPDAPKE